MAKKKSPKLSPLDAFIHHGVTPVQKTLNHKDVRGSCPFCDSSDALSINQTTSQWRCFACEVGGNLTVFLNLIHQKHLDATTDKHYQTLSAERGNIPWKLFRHHDLAFDSTYQRWLLPFFNLPTSTVPPSVVQLKTWSAVTSLRNTPGLPSALFNLHRLSPLGPIFLTEGEWDAIALDYIFFQNNLYDPQQAPDSEHAGPAKSPNAARAQRRTKLPTPQPSAPISLANLGTPSILSAPGATTFKEEWCRYFAGRNVFLLYDHDESGRVGMERVADLLNNYRQRPKSINIIQWPAHLPPKFDIRDLVTKQIKQPKSTWATLQGYLGIVDSPVGPTTPRPPAENLSPKYYHTNTTVQLSKSDPARTETFTKLVSRYAEDMLLTPYITSGIAVSLSTILSIRVQGDPLWLFLIGPPGSGKSLILQSFAEAEEFVNYQSKLRATSLVSGMGGSSYDPSTIKDIAGKCLIVKDYTAVKSMPAQTQEELYGLLRDAYDGKINIQYGNGVVRNYANCHFSMLAGVTDVIHGDQRAALGERFLKCELVGPDYDATAQIMAAIDDSTEDKVLSNHVKDSAQYYLRFLATLDSSGNMPAIPVPDAVKKRILNLAQLTGILRSSSLQDKNNPLAYRPRPEVGTRLGKQLVKLGRFLALTTNRKTFDDDVYRVIQRVGFDTAHGWNLEILTLIINHGEITTPDLANCLSVSSNTLDRLMGNLLALRVVDTHIQSGVAGHVRPTRVWTVKPHILEFWKEAQLDQKDYKQPSAPRRKFKPTKKRRPRRDS